VQAIPYSADRKLRLAYFVTHPIQYQAPQLKRIAQEPDIDLNVFFGSDLSIRGDVDQEFGVRVQWDTPLLEGYNYEFLPRWRDARDGEIPGFSRPLNKHVAKRIGEEKVDAVWVHGYHYLTHMLAIRAASARNIPVLLRTDSSLHDRPRSALKLAAKKVFFNLLRPHISGVLSVGEENTAYWRENLGPDVRVFRCNYAVDNEFFQRQCEAAAKTREEFRSSLCLEPGRPVILFAAKLIPRKRCGDLLEAFLKLIRSWSGGPKPYLLIVGDGEQRAALEARAAQASAGDVRFLGFRNQSELPRFYDLCDVFVLASVDEPWGLAINEVMNAGRPVIVSDQVGCHKDLVKSGVNGFVVRPGDPGELAESLRTVLADPERCRIMGQESQKIVANYSFNQNVTGLRQALQAVRPGFPAFPISAQ
jgi:glycosyltransferase involved in cell wall biosynthesis